MNKKLMLEVAKRIEEDPTSYDQSSFCGTAFCVAGHAMMAAGYMQSGSKTGDGDFVKDGHFEWADEKATELLCLTQDESDELFDESWRPFARYTVPEQLRLYADGTDSIL